ncbi:MAG: hypothetical protein ACOZAQ_03255 [Pseudomonadota bacterium]
MKHGVPACAALLACALGGPALADPPHGRRDDGPGLILHFSFTERERIYLGDYYHRHLPPGLARQGKVPPGHAKRLARGMPWPPGVPYERLPERLERDLQPLPRNHARFIVGPDVVIVDLGARVIVDAVRLFD